MVLAIVLQAAKFSELISGRGEQNQQGPALVLTGSIGTCVPLDLHAEDGPMGLAMSVQVFPY